MTKRRGGGWAGGLAVAGLLLVVSIGAGRAAEIHGENSSFAGHGILMAWGILKATIEDQSQVVVRIVPVEPAYTHLRVDGVDPFTQNRQEVVSARPLGQGAEVRSPRGSFAEFTRREFHFFTADDWRAERPSLTVYFMGVPDTSPEFLAEAPLSAYLVETIAKLKGGAGQKP